MTDGEILAREGDSLASAGRLEEALRKYDEALRADELVNKHHPDVASRYCAIGALYRTVGDNDAAMEYFAKALQVEEASEHHERRVALAKYLSNLAGTLRAAGHLSSANDHYCRALDHLRAIIPPDAARVAAQEDREMFDVDAPEDTRGHPSPDACPPAKLLGRGGVLDVAGSVLNNLGLLMKSAGEMHCARRLYLRSISLAVVAVGEHDPVIGTRTRNLGAALLGLGYAAAAVEKLEAARRACSLGFGADHPETEATSEWLAAAREGAGKGDHEQDFARAAALPDVAEWFIRELDCGVLEPRPEPLLEGEPEAYAPAPEGDEGVSPMPLPPEVVVGRDANAGEGAEREATDDDAARAGSKPPRPPKVFFQAPPTSGAAPARRAARLFAPLEPAEGEDLLTPYTKPATAVVGGSDASPVWREVAAERADIVSTGEAMPKGQDYIAAYLKQAPGYANLITPFSEMPCELLMPYQAYRGYGVPRSSKAALPRLAHQPRVLSPDAKRLGKASALGFQPHPSRLGGRGAEPGEGFLEAFVGTYVAGGGATAVEARAPD